MKVHQVINKNTVVEGFTAEQAIKMINLFFNQIIRLSSLFYVVSLISYYSISYFNVLNQGFTERAFRLTADNDKLLVIRQFFSTVC